MVNERGDETWPHTRSVLSRDAVTTIPPAVIDTPARESVCEREGESRHHHPVRRHRHPCSRKRESKRERERESERERERRRHHAVRRHRHPWWRVDG